MLKIAEHNQCDKPQAELFLTILKYCLTVKLHAHMEKTIRKNQDSPKESGKISDIHNKSKENEERQVIFQGRRNHNAY